MKPINELRQITNVKVFSFQYEVRWVASAKSIYKQKFPDSSEEDSDVWGWCDFSENYIYIDEMLLKSNPLRAAEILLHEWIHAGHEFLNLEDRSTEEEYTTLTAKMILAFIKDNPAEMKLLFDIASAK